MSELLNDLDFAVERDVAKEPPKRWLNWWSTRHSGPVYGPDRRFLFLAPAGTVHNDNIEWPSREVAEQKAFDEIEMWSNCPLADADFHLGAFPEGERP